MTGASEAVKTSPKAVLESDTEADLSRIDSRRRKSKRITYGPNTVISVWQKEHPTYDGFWLTCVKVKHFTTRPELEIELRLQGKGWVVDAWREERAKLKAIQEAFENYLPIGGGLA